jgi:signal transduction histidine kinase
VREDRAEISVTDCGIGIGPEDRERLFTRFGRMVTDENSHIPGTGLGLYLSRELARMHGGEVDFESAKGLGSTFRLVLPLAPEHAGSSVPG